MAVREDFNTGPGEVKGGNILSRTLDKISAKYHQVMDGLEANPEIGDSLKKAVGLTLTTLLVANGVVDTPASDAVFAVTNMVNTTTILSILSRASDEGLAAQTQRGR